MIYLGADHGGVQFLRRVRRALPGLTVRDLGPKTIVPTDDYPLIAGRVARQVARTKSHRGILVCRTGVGMAVAANKIAGIRAVQGTSVPVAVRSRQEEDSNILALAAAYLTVRAAVKIVRAWLREPFRPRPRYRRRLRQLTRLDHGR